MPKRVTAILAFIALLEADRRKLRATQRMHRKKYQNGRYPQSLRDASEAHCAILDRTCEGIALTIKELKAELS